MNLFKRSGFANHLVPHHWQFWPGTDKGPIVADDASPEAGMEVLAGDILNEANHNLAFELEQGVIQEGVYYTVSYIFKPGTKDFAVIRDGANSEGISKRSYFDLKNLSIGSIHPNHRNPFVQDLGNGLVRFGLSFKATDLDTPHQRTLIVGVAETNGSNVFVGVPGDLIATAYHSQLELGLHVSAPEVTKPEPV
jgi:hypothetical protein